MTHGQLITDRAGIDALLARTRRVAVLGIKTEAQRDQPAYYVPAALAAAGLAIVPVPVYYPDARTILGQPVVRSLAELEPGVDLIDVFRRPQDLPAHLDALIAAKPKAVWLQSGIRHDAVAERLTEAGIDVVQDRCLMVEHRRWQVQQAGSVGVTA